jgi:phosphatidylglycerophosphatase A
MDHRPGVTGAAVRAGGEVAEGARDDAPRPGDKTALWILSCGGLGFLPLVPGTFGTLGGVALALLLPEENHLVWVLVAAAIASALTVALGPAACRATGRSDPQSVVMDEVAGVLLVFAITPVPTMMETGLAFLCFRIFDIVKPPPAGRLERLPGGWGILLDDLVAGLYALGLFLVLRGLV